MKARLTSFIFLKPRPPATFGRHREDQDLRERFLALARRNPHPKFLKAWSNLLQILAGSMKVLMV
jgi:hypothetical protein